MNVETRPLTDWIGSTEGREDTIGLTPALGVHAMLDRAASMPAEGDALPPLWHWFYFLPQVAASKIGHDGHPERGGFMPPVDLPRRMFAGARLTFHAPLVIGQMATREAEILSVTEKSGSSGKLVFVTVRYRIRQASGTLAIEEEQDIVYKEPGPNVPAPVPADDMPELPAGAWSRTVAPNEVLLFRFSALTFNAHRIHYDRRYAMEEEGYPGLVVHGPLTAVMLAELTGENCRQRMASFTFKGRAPLFDLAAFRLVGVREGSGVDLQAQGPDGKTTMTATAQLVD